MPPLEPTQPTMGTEGGRSLLWAAVEANALELELTLVRAFQGVAAFGLLIAIWVAVLVDQQFGWAMVAIALWVLVWYTIAHGAMAQGIGLRWFEWLNPMVEVLLPAFMLIAIVRTEGPEYAIASWVPPQLFAVFIAGSILRLKPAQPVVMGLVAGAAYGAAYFVVIRPELGEAPPLLAQPAMQLVRVLTLVVMGAAAGLAVLGLRRIVSHAGRDVRSQELFGKYRLGREIASGGMGRVLAATYCPEGGFKRRVAVKIIHPHLARNPKFLEDFRREAELCSGLVHPNVVAALDFGRVDDTWFFAMEFVDGATLNEILKLRRETGQGLAPQMVLFLATEITQGLHFAHAVARDEEGQRLRIVHRDLTPTNVLMCRAGRVRLSDFGVARALGDRDDSCTETMAGKPGYMAPELLRNQTCDERADLWALGVIIWEMLCNDRLFGRDTAEAAMLAVVNAEIPTPSEACSEVGPFWDELVGRLLERDPDRRFGSALEVLDALRALRDDVGIACADDVAALVCASEDVPMLDLDSTEDWVRAGVFDEDRRSTPTPGQ